MITNLYIDSGYKNPYHDVFIHSCCCFVNTIIKDFIHKLDANVQKMFISSMFLFSSLVFAQNPYVDMHHSFGVGLSHTSTQELSAYEVDEQINLAPTTKQLWEHFFAEEDDDALMIIAELLVQRTASDWPNDYRGDFLREVAPAALISAKKNQIYPSVVLAQGVLESGWGRSNLAVQHNNLFGVKGRRGHRSVLIHTLESVRGKIVRRDAYFRNFISWAESIAYHGELLGSSHYYQFAKPIARDARHYLELIAPRYASQPDYAASVSVLIEAYQLDRWDFTLDMVRSK